MRMSDVVFGFIWQVLFTHDNVVSFYSIFGALLVISSIFVLILNKESPAAAAKSKGKDLELREGRGGGERYNVLHTDEDMDASRGQTAIDISSHSEASDKSWDREEGGGGVRRNPLRDSGNVEDIDDPDLYDEDKGVLATFGPRKRQNSAGCEPAAAQSVDVATMKARLNDAMRG